jgi:AcrR family transcriptional regulator
MMSRNSERQERRVREAQTQQLNGWERRRVRVAARIEQAALALFAASGYESVTLAEIAAAGAVSPATLTRYFPLKEDLLLAEPRRIRGRMLELIASLRGTPTPISDLVDGFKDRAVAYEDERPQFQLWNKAISTAPEIHAKVLGEDVQVLSGPISQLCSEALSVDARDQLSPSVVANALIAANHATVRFWSEREGIDDLVQLLDEMYVALRQSLPLL